MKNGTASGESQKKAGITELHGETFSPSSSAGLPDRLDAGCSNEPVALQRAWSENKCGDKDCEQARLKAAIKVLTGAATHREIADKVLLDAADPTAITVPRAVLERVVNSYDGHVIDELRAAIRASK